MDTVLFFLFSFLEYAVIVLLLLTLFRLPVKDYLLPIVMIGFFESGLSYLLRYSTQMANLSVFMQILLMIIAFKFFSRIQWFYSSVAVLVSYCAYSTLQIICFLLFNYFGIFEMQQLSKEIVEGVSLIGYLLQITTVILTSLLIGLLKSKNMGWQFIPDAFRRVNYGDPINLTLLIVVIISIALLGLMVYISILANMAYLLALLSFLTICLSVLVHLSNRKEKLHD